MGSHKCSHPRDQWPHEANLTGPVTHLTNLTQSHTNTHTTGILPVLFHAHHIRHSQVPAHRALRAFTPGYSQTQPGERFGRDPQRNMNFKQILHNKPQREAWVLLCCAESCPTLWDPMDCSPPGSSVHGILQARILEGVAMPSSRGSSLPGD